MQQHQLAPLTTASPAKTPPRLTLPWIMAGLILPLIINAARATAVLIDPAIPFDTEHTYLPMARQLLEAPLSFWNDPKVLSAAPGASIYMALAGADIATIKSWNMVLALASITLLFDAARRIAGRIAAASAAWLYALSPTLITINVWPMVEPPFLFLVAFWFWACTLILEPNNLKKPAHTSIFFAGMALALATLTRATYMYWIPAIVLACGGAYALFPLQRVTWRRLIGVHLIALVFVGGYIIWNASKFHTPTIATGAGAALYFGSNPMLRGQEPPFFGLIHDNVTVTDELGHLSIAGDARLREATRIIYTTLPASTLATMYLYKATTLLFFSKSHLLGYIDRLWRVTLLTMAMCGVWLGRRYPAIWVCAGAALYQWAVHIPALYNPRYSISALDTPLTILAAVGIALLWRARLHSQLVSAALVFSAAAAATGAWHQRYSTPSLPLLDLVPHQRLLQAEFSDLSVENMSGNPFEGAGASTPTGRFSLVWARSFPDLDGTTLLELGIEKMSGTCKRVQLIGINQRGEERTAHIRLREWRGIPNFAWGLAYTASHGPLSQLRLDFECTAGSSMSLSHMRLYEASLGRRTKNQAIQLAP